VKLKLDENIANSVAPRLAALGFDVDTVLWQSRLMRYRLPAKFQNYWKEELGHWLRMAGWREQFGFLDPGDARDQAPSEKTIQKGQRRGSGDGERRLKTASPSRRNTSCVLLQRNGLGFLGYERRTGRGRDRFVPLGPRWKGGRVSGQSIRPAGVAREPQVIDGEDDATNVGATLRAKHSTDR
jgi:hypothetical protein